MNPLTTGLVLLACAAFMTLLGVLARIKRRQLTQYDHAQKDFYRHAGALLGSSQVPDDIVRFLDFGARALGTRWALLLFILSAPFARRPAEPSETRLSKAVRALPPAMKKHFDAVVDAFFGTLCWQNLFLSWIFRCVTRPVRDPHDDNVSKNELALVERVCARAA